MQQVISKKRRSEPDRLQVVGGTRNRVPVNSATGMNHHIQASVFNVIIESDFQFDTLRPVAKMFRLPESQILDILRTQVRNLIASSGKPPSGPSVATWPARRAA